VDRKQGLVRIQKDEALAKANNISATPTVFVNGMRVDGAPSREHLLTLIQEALKEATASPLER
jgi:protein-disulfide isomerase